MQILECWVVVGFPFLMEVSAKRPLLTARDNLLLAAVCQHAVEATGGAFIRKTFGNSKHDSFWLI